MNDTSPEVAALQVEIYRRLTEDERLALAFEMSDITRAFCVAGLREEHPDWTDGELALELARYAFLTPEGPKVALPQILR